MESALGGAGWFLLHRSHLASSRRLTEETMISLLFKKEYNPITWAPKPAAERSPGVPLPKAPSQQTVVRKAPVIGVLGVKGGAGATTIAINLAFAMSKRYGSATLIDANLQQPDTAAMLG